MTPRFIGREEELGTLVKALKEAISEKGKFFLVTGETGIGKTRLLHEFANVSREHGALVLSTRCTGTPAPYSAVETVLNQLNEGIKSSLPLGLAFSEGAEKAGEFAMRAKTMVLERFLRKFEEISERQTCVFLVDDLQWADTGTLNFIHYLSRNVERLRLVVVCAYGSEYTTMESVFVQVLRNLNIERQVKTIVLDKLSPSQAAEIVLNMVPTWKSPKKVLDVIYKKTGGNPFFIEEVCRVLQQVRPEELQNPKLAELLPIPPGIKNLINYRLQNLSEKDINVLRYCAVLGNTFEYAVLEKIARMDEEALLDSLESLINAGYLKEDAEETYSFAQSIVRDTIYSQVILPRKKIMHKTVADVMADMYREDERFVESIGRHYLLAGEYERAAQFILLTAENALRNYVMEDAMFLIRELETIIEKLPENEMKCTIIKKYYLISGDCKNITADFKGAIEAYEKCLEMEEDVVRRAEISVKLAHAYLSTGNFKGAVELLTSALSQVSEKNYETLAELLGAIGQCFEKIGEYGKSVEYYLQALECAEHTKNEVIIASAYHRAGTGMWFAGELEKATEYLEKALKIRKKHNLKKEIAATYNNMGIVYLYLGEWEKATECYTTAKKIWEEIGDLAGVSTAYNNLAGVWSNLGDHEKAIEFASNDLEISRRTGNKYYEIYALTGLGNEYEKLNQCEKAMEYYLVAMDLCKQTSEKRMYSSLLARIGTLYAKKGDFENAYKYIEEAMKVVKETEFWDTKAEVISARATILELNDKTDEAEDAYLEAIRLYQNAGAEESAMDVYCDMAEMFIKIGRKNEAKSILEDALKFYSGKKFLKAKAEHVQKLLKNLEI